MQLSHSHDSTKLLKTFTPLMGFEPQIQKIFEQIE